MTHLYEQEAAKRVSRRVALASLAGGVAGLTLLGTAPATALAKSVVRPASAIYTRGQTLYTYKGLLWGIYTVDWAPNGTRIVTAGTDPMVGDIATVWDPLTGDNVVTYNGDGHIVRSGKWAPDGKLIA